MSGLKDRRKCATGHCTASLIGAKKSTPELQLTLTPHDFGKYPFAPINLIISIELTCDVGLVRRIRRRLNKFLVELRRTRRNAKDLVSECSYRTKASRNRIKPLIRDLSVNRPGICGGCLV